MATLSGGFRGASAFGSLQNIVDGLPGGLGPPQRTLGGTLIDQLPLQPSLMAPWSINGWTIGFELWGFTGSGAGRQAYGRFGNIYGGLCTPGQTTAQPSGSAQVAPVQPFPGNASLITLIWDGDQSVSPPLGSTQPTPPSRISFSFPLPQPEIIQPGDQLSIGLWLTPSVIADTQLCILNATWSIVYDERSSTATTTA